MFLKRIFIVLALAIVIFTIDANAQQNICPTGYQQTTVQLWAGGCEWDVVICFKCGMTSANDVRVYQMKKVDPNCDESTIFNELWESIYDQVYNWDFISTFICPGAIVGPCDQYPGGLFYTETLLLCWSKQFDESGHLTYEICNDEYSQTICYTMYKLCWDPILQQVVKVTVQGPELSGGFHCQNVEEPTSTPNAPNWSTCFEITTPCNPD